MVRNRTKRYKINDKTPVKPGFLGLSECLVHTFAFKEQEKQPRVLTTSQKKRPR